MNPTAALHTAINKLLVTSALLVLLTLTSLTSGWCAEIIIIGDAHLKPVAEVIDGIRKSTPSPPRIIAPADIRGSLLKTVTAEEAKVVIALGKEAVDKALQLPATVPVICSLVISVPRTLRPNTVCGLMATPVSEYLSLIRQYFPSLKKTAVFSNPEIQRSFPAGLPGQLAVHQANSSFELIASLRQLTGIDSILLLPDVSIMTTTALEEVFLYSFKHRVPVFGVSEKHVKQGSLFALVFDSSTIGRQLGEKATEALSGGGLVLSQSFPARKYNLYLNADTAQKMGIALPDELVRRARKVYP